MRKLEIDSINVDEFKELLSTLVRSELKQFKDTFDNKVGEKLLTREQACSILSINRSTLWKFTKEGKLNSYRMGNRVYYLNSEIFSAIKPSKKTGHA